MLEITAKDILQFKNEVMKSLSEISQKVDELKEAQEALKLEREAQKEAEGAAAMEQIPVIKPVLDVLIEAAKRGNKFTPVTAEYYVNRKCPSMNPLDKSGAQYLCRRIAANCRNFQARNPEKIIVLKNDFALMVAKIKNALTGIYGQFGKVPISNNPYDFWAVEDQTQLPPIDEYTIVVDEKYYYEGPVGAHGHPPNKLMLVSRLSEDSNEVAFIVFHVFDWMYVTKTPTPRMSRQERTVMLKQQTKLRAEIEVAAEDMAGYASYLFHYIAKQWEQNSERMKTVNTIQQYINPYEWNLNP